MFTCNIDDICTVNECKNVDILCVQDNNIIKNCDDKLENKIENLVSTEPYMKVNRLYDVCMYTFGNTQCG